MFLPRLISTKVIKRTVSTTTKTRLIPCNSCMHYDENTQKCTFKYMIEDNVNYVIVGSGKNHISAVDARNNESYCGKNASKFAYCDYNFMQTIVTCLGLTVWWTFPTITVYAFTLSYCMFIPYLANIIYICSNYTPTYKPLKT